MGKLLILREEAAKLQADIREIETEIDYLDKVGRMGDPTYQPESVRAICRRPPADGRTRFAPKELPRLLTDLIRESPVLLTTRDPHRPAQAQQRRHLSAVPALATASPPASPNPAGPNGPSAPVGARSGSGRGVSQPRSGRNHDGFGPHRTQCHESGKVERGKRGRGPAESVPTGSTSAQPSRNHWGHKADSHSRHGLQGTNCYALSSAPHYLTTRHRRMA